MRIVSLLAPAVLLLVAGAVGEAAVGHDRSQCSSVPAHHTVEVTSGGEYANPPDVGGWPSRPGCEIAYVVDFVSAGPRMSSFVPDRDWVKGSFSGTSCVGQCRDIEYLKFRGVVDVYRCTSPRGCRSRHFSKVGSYAVRYGKAIRPLRCAALLGPGDSIPTVRDSHGVRLVIKYDIARYVDFEGPQCEKAPLPMPQELGFNASGTAGFPVLAPVDEKKRPKAEPIG